MSELDVSPQPNATTSRRSFLKGGLAGGAALVAASGGYLALRKGKATPAAPRALKSLSPESFPVLAAVIARVVPQATQDEVVELAMSIDETLTYTPETTRKEMNFGIRLLENGLAGLLSRGSATPFTLLSPEAQDEALRRWRDASVGPLNAAYHGLRKLTFGKYYQILAHSRPLGYPGPVFEKPDPGPIEPRGRLSPPFVVGTQVTPQEPAHE